MWTRPKTGRVGGWPPVAHTSTNDACRRIPCARQGILSAVFPELGYKQANSYNSDYCSAVGSHQTSLLTRTLPMSASAWMLTTMLAIGQGEAPKPEKKEFTPPVGAFRLRSLGPSVTSGRIAALAVNPKNRAHFYAAVASGGVWKTTNSGTTWTPIFDGEGSYSIGAITLDPQDVNTIWVGSGENNSQRSVAYGDGVYKSTDAGRSWQNVGLKKSEHIAKILVHPKNSDVVYVAAQGPLWGAGGERGLYKTADGGKNWERVLHIDDDTGVTDVVMDPRNPDILVAASYQRRRHVWTLVNGGPGSGMHRSIDGGKTWKKITSGLPGAEIGRIGLAMAPSDPDTIYAQVEAAEKAGGIFRSQDLGKTWEKRNPFDSQAQYFCTPTVDPVNRDRLYLMHVVNQVSDDGGATLKTLGDANKHVDSHCIWIDPTDPKYYLCGCDGGVYESVDAASNWVFKANLPVTQFYDIAVDQNPKSGPFYHVYGGTQDNYTLGGPVRTRSRNGIVNADWYVVQGGDGFHCKVDPDDPNIVYAEYQYAGLVRFDRRTGNRVDIRPIAGKGEPPLRWNWDSPLIISPHSSKRLYFAGNKLFKSDDRGDSWVAISPDLTRQLDRDKLKVFGKIQSPEAVSKHVSTSFYGNIVALAESSKKEGLIYIGTDDGLIQITENGGKNWRKIDLIAGVPEGTYVSKLVCSQYEADTVYALFDAHKNADFKPYLMKSTDAGKNWVSVAGNLPERGTVYCLAEDHLNPNLLFCGTEFGLFCTVDGGKKWHPMKNGLPAVQVKDLVIQKQNQDLVVGTFGRGFYVVDDYSALRSLTTEDAVKKDAVLPPDSVYAYVPFSQLGGNGKSFQGAAHYFAENPAYGATFTVTLKETLKTKKQLRKDKEAEAKKANKEIEYPKLDDLRTEAEEEAPSVTLLITDSAGDLMRRVNCPTGEGIHRVTWNLQDAGVNPDGGEGYLALPGKYTAQLYKRHDGKATKLSEPVAFEIKPDPLGSLTPAEYTEIARFNKEVRTVQKQLNAATRTTDELTTKVDQMRKALKLAAKPDDETDARLTTLAEQLRVLARKLNGDGVLAARNENVPDSISSRIGYASNTHDDAITKPTGTANEALKIGKEELGEVVKALRGISETELPPIEKRLDGLGVPWTPGRLPLMK
jgi:photosystem II stability/assembly factor-like uncharacterized protein